MSKNDNNPDGFTLIEVFIAMLIIGLLASIAIMTLFKYRQTAYDTLTLSDLDRFKKAQILYQIEHDSYHGNIGDTVGNDGAPSTFTVFDYNPGAGIRITVISSPDPFIVEAVNTKSDTVIEYNFATGQILKK